MVKNVVDLIWCGDKSLCFWHFPMSMRSSLPHSFGPWKNCKPFQGKKMQDLRFLGVVFGFPKICRGQICNLVAYFTLGSTTWLLLALVVSTHFTTMFVNWEIFLEKDLNIQRKSLNVHLHEKKKHSRLLVDILLFIWPAIFAAQALLWIGAWCRWWRRRLRGCALLRLQHHHVLEVLPWCVSERKGSYPWWLSWK